MAHVSVRIEGTASVEQAYATIREGADDMPGTQAQIGQIVKTRIRTYAPKRTGWLASTITARALPDQMVITVAAVYAGVIEWGWRARGIPGQHYANRGIYASQGAIVGFYASGLQTVVDTAQAGA